MSTGLAKGHGSKNSPVVLIENAIEDDSAESSEGGPDDENDADEGSEEESQDLNNDAGPPIDDESSCPARCSWCHMPLPRGQCCLSNGHRPGAYPWHACLTCLLGSGAVATHHLRAENGGARLRLPGYTLSESRQMLAHGLTQRLGTAHGPAQPGQENARERSRSSARQEPREGLCHHACSVCNARWCGRERGHRYFPWPQHCCAACEGLRDAAYQNAASSGSSTSSSDTTAGGAIGALPLVCHVCNGAIGAADATRRCRWLATSVGRHCGTIADSGYLNPLDKMNEAGSGDSTSLPMPGSFCCICGKFARVPFARCNYCGDSPSYHHGLSWCTGAPSCLSCSEQVADEDLEI